MRFLFHVWSGERPSSLGNAREIALSDQHAGEQPQLDSYARWLLETFPSQGREDDVLPQGVPKPPYLRRVLRFGVNLVPEGWQQPKYLRDTQLYRMLVDRALQGGLQVLVREFAEAEQMANRLARDAAPGSAPTFGPEDPGSLHILPRMRCPPAWFWDYLPDAERKGSAIAPIDVQRVILTRLASALRPHGFRMAPPALPSLGPVLSQVLEHGALAIAVPCVAVQSYHGVEAELSFTMVSKRDESPSAVMTRLTGSQLLGFPTAICVRNAADLKVAASWMESTVTTAALPALRKYSIEQGEQ